MKKILMLMIFMVCAAHAQNKTPEAYAEFKSRFESYRDNPEVASENSTLKPGPCGQYALKYMVTAKGFEEQVNVPPARKLCFDLNRFDKSKNPQAPADWDYEIKPIGDRYYVIRAEKKGSGVQEFYYYERAKK